MDISPRLGLRWSPVADGTAVGPTRHIGNGGSSIRATALWSDDDGLVIDLDVPDEVIPRCTARKLAVAITVLCDLPDPTNSE